MHNMRPRQKIDGSRDISKEKTYTPGLGKVMECGIDIEKLNEQLSINYRKSKGDE